MKRPSWEIILVAVIVIAIFWIRMEIATSTPSLSYDSYLTVRQVEHIQETGTPLRTDPLSTTGATRITNPIFNYLLAGATIATPLMYKILPNLFMALLLIPIYFLARRITQSTTATFIAVVLAATGPVVFSSYLNTPSETPLAILLLLSIISLMHDTDKHLFLIIILSILLTFISPLIFILMLSLLAIILLLRVEGFGIDPRVNELFFFTLLLAMWFYVIVYKQALFASGLAVLWSNLPTELAVITFGNISMLTVLYGLGVITFLLGSFGVYYALFETKERTAYPVIGAIITVIVVLLLRVITIGTGLVLLTLLLSVMAASGLLIMMRYLRMTKTPWIVYPAAAVIVILFIFTAILPALVNASAAMAESPTTEDIAALRELNVRLPQSALLLTPIKEAAAVQYYAKRRTVTDDDFLLVNNGDELINDINSVYASRFSTSVLTRAEKLGFTHILFTPVAAQQYARPGLYSADEECLPSEQAGSIILYRVACGGEE